jgi:ABC-type transport system involved in cytochrome bd biosynthesis fused ATPase/permease subunit
MDKGMIIEDGSFSTLMNKKGLFYSMYISQSSCYEKEEDVKDGGVICESAFG